MRNADLEHMIRTGLIIICSLVSGLFGVLWVVPFVRVLRSGTLSNQSTGCIVDAQPFIELGQSGWPGNYIAVWETRTLSVDLSVPLKLPAWQHAGSLGYALAIMPWPAANPLTQVQVFMPLGPSCLFFGVFPGICFVRGPVRRWHRRRRNRCVRCGYNLTGLTEPRCPECGNKW